MQSLLLQHTDRVAPILGAVAAGAATFAAYQSLRLRQVTTKWLEAEADVATAVEVMEREFEAHDISMEDQRTSFEVERDALRETIYDLKHNMAGKVAECRQLVAKLTHTRSELAGADEEADFLEQRIEDLEVERDEHVSLILEMEKYIQHLDGEDEPHTVADENESEEAVNDADEMVTITRRQAELIRSSQATLRGYIDSLWENLQVASDETDEALDILKEARECWDEEREGLLTEIDRLQRTVDSAAENVTAYMVQEENDAVVIDELSAQVAELDEELSSRHLSPHVTEAEPAAVCERASMFVSDMKEKYSLIDSGAGYPMKTLRDATNMPLNNGKRDVPVTVQPPIEQAAAVA